MNLKEMALLSYLGWVVGNHWGIRIGVSKGGANYRLQKINGFGGKSNNYMLIFLYVPWKGSLKFENDKDAGNLSYAHKLFLINGYFL